MELREFAERILFGPALEDKLLRPAQISDRSPGGVIEVPVLPARNPEMAPRPRLRPPPRNLEHEEPRGELLHFFANHELLALEIMALALLRFPEAPRRFRLGLAAIMQEEQRHLKLYVRRMREFGVAFGQYELNDFFWRRLRDVRDPLDFSVRMSLTFEQANLDFADFYRRAFARMGDTRTSAILEEVLRDEIVHVKRGLSFFERTRPGRATAWREYLDLLPPGLDACRARGSVFAVEPRVAAGIPADFIESLRNHRRSKGRPPCVFLFDPFIESDLRSAGPARKSVSQLRLAADLATAMVLFSRNEDVVLCNRKPSQRYLEGLASVDFPIPEFVRLRTLSREPRKLSDVRPWGWTPRLEEKLAGQVDQIVGQARTSLVEMLRVTRGTRAWAVGKDTARGWEEELGGLGGARGRWTVCRSRAEAVAAVALLHEQGRTALMRPLIGAAGNGQRRLPPGTPVGRLAYPVIAEALEERLCDFSTHIQIGEHEVRTIGWTRQLVSPEGRYVGSLVGRLFDPQELLFFSEDGPGAAQNELLSVRSRLFEAAREVGERLRVVGFRGPVGIDAFLFRGHPTGQVQLRCVVDVNVRFTMGRLALEASRRMQSGRTGLLLQVGRSAVRDRRPAPFSGLCDRLLPEIVGTPGRLIARGVLPVTDAYRARRHAVIFCVGRTPADCAFQLAQELTPQAPLFALLSGLPSQA